MSTWAALPLAKACGFPRMAWAFMPVAGEPSRSQRAPAVVPQFCLNLLGSTPEGHPRSKKRQEQQHVCVPGIVTWVERCPARPEAGPARKVLVHRCARSCWEAEMGLTCIRQPATWRAREEIFGDQRILLGQEQLILNWPIVSIHFHHSSQVPVHKTSLNGHLRSALHFLKHFLWVVLAFTVILWELLSQFLGWIFFNF